MGEGDHRGDPRGPGRRFADHPADAGTPGRFLINAWEGAIVGERAAKDGSSSAAFFTVAFKTVLR